MKKKLLSALLVVAMLATTVVGCGFTGTPEEKAPAASTETAEGDETAPADITNMGLIYNTIFTSFPGNG